MRTRCIILLLTVLLITWGCAPVGPPDPPPDDGGGPAVTDGAGKGKPLPSGLRNRVEAAVRDVRARTLLTGNAFWTIFHGILGLGPDVELTNGATGAKVNALEYIRKGGALRGLAFQPTANGVEVLTLRDTEGQGHQDQFIAEMAQWGMDAKATFKVQGREYSFLDFVKNAQLRARTTTDQELSWTIVVVAQYLGTDAAWANINGEELTLEDLIRYEVKAPVVGAACGGTHRLFGLSWAYHLHLGRGGKTEGVWKDVVARTDEYIKKAKRLQGSDGAFSTSWFEARANEPDKNLRLNTSGHTLEWLALALPDKDLKAEWVQAAASAVSQMILEMGDAPIDSGSMYHAVHGLQIYHARMFGGDFTPKKLMVPLPPGWAAVKR
jgi:hypothetical protein